MRVFFVLIFILSGSFSLFGQYLSLSQLEYLSRQKDWHVINNYLLQRGWTFHKVEDNLITWGYNISKNLSGWSYDEGVSYDYKAAAWFYAMKSGEIVGKIGYAFADRERYFSLLKALKSKGYREYDNETSDDALVTRYKNGRYYVEIRISQSDEQDFFGNIKQIYFITVYPKGSIFDEFNGHKVIYTFDGKEEYDLKDGLKHGKYVKYYLMSSQPEIVGYYSYGMREGKFTEYYKTGNIRCECFYKNDLLEGERKLYYPNGALKELGVFRNGLPWGRFYAYDSLGRILLEADYYGDLDTPRGFYKVYFYDFLHIDGQPVTVISEGNYDTLHRKIGLWKRYYVSGQDTFYFTKEQYFQGKLHGLYQEALGHLDTFIVANYKFGRLDGEYKIYMTKHFTFIKTLRDTADAILVQRGKYKNGYKTGKWLTFDSCGNVILEENYAMGLLNGIVKLYYPTGFENDLGFTFPCSTPDSIRLQSVTPFLLGQKHGEAVNYYFKLLNGQIFRPVWKNYIISVDTLKLLRFKEVVNYKHGKKDGQYTLFDPAGGKIVSGSYRDNKKVGKWTQFLGYYIMITGYFSDDKANGRWQIYLKPDSLLSDSGLITQKYLLLASYPELKPTSVVGSYYVDNGVILRSEFKEVNGIVSRYYFRPDSNAKLIELYKGNKKFFSQIPVYDSSNSLLQSLKTYVYRNDTTEFYEVKPKTLGVWFDTTFFKDYVRFKSILSQYADYLKTLPSLVLSKDISTSILAFKLDGQYYMLRNRDTLVKGQYADSRRVGKWLWFYREQGIMRQVLFEQDTIVSERFFQLYSSKPYSGKFKAPTADGYVVYRIKNGLKHGVARFYNRQGKLLRKERYKNGVRL